MADWFYSEGDQRLGPVPGAVLKQLAQAGKITPDTLVWTQGAADWVEARTVKGLFPQAMAAPPPVPFQPPASQAGVSQPGAFGQAGTTDGGAQMLAYAPTGLRDGTLAPAPFAPPPDDPGPFQKMGGRFSVGGQQWTGKSFVSPYAIYLLKIARNRQRSYGVGGLLAVAISAAFTKDDLTRSCDITELPPTIRAKFDPKFKKKKGDVIILNRESMTRVKWSAWTGLTAMIGAEKFPISPPFFGGRKMRRFMAENGWVFNQDLIPTAAPMHGKAYGLDDTTARQRQKKSVFQWIMIALLVFFGLIIVLSIVLAGKH